VENCATLSILMFAIITWVTSAAVGTTLGQLDALHVYGQVVMHGGVAHALTSV
jgi:hypothetical protein